MPTFTFDSSSTPSLNTPKLSFGAPTKAKLKPADADAAVTTLFDDGFDTSKGFYGTLGAPVKPVAPALKFDVPAEAKPSYGSQVKKAYLDTEKRAAATLMSPFIGDENRKVLQDQGTLPGKPKTIAQSVNEGPVGTGVGAIYAPASALLSPLVNKATDYAQKQGVPSSAIEDVQAGLNILGVAGSPIRGERILSTAAKDGENIVPGKLHSEDVAAAAGAPSNAGVPFQSKIFTPDQPVASTQAPTSTKGLSDRLFQQQQSSLADQKEMSKWLQSNVGNVSKELGEKFLDHADDPKGVPLAPHEAELFNKTIGAMKEEIDANRREIGAAGLDPGMIDVESGSLGGAIRQRIGMNTPLDRMTGVEPRPVESGRSLSKSAGTFKGRSMMALTREDGTRAPVYINDEGQIFDASKKGAAPIGVYDEAAGTAIEGSKTLGKIGEATRKEIEAATGGEVTYHKNAFGVYGTTLLQTRRAVRSARLLEDIKKSPKFNEVAHSAKSKGKIPTDETGEHWRQVPGIPAFKDYYFAPRYAEELEDFAHGMKRGMGELNKLDALNRFSLNLLFFMNPYHAYNVAEMALVTKGAAGLAKDLPGTVKDFGESVKDVALLRKPYVKYARAGVSLPGMKTAAEDFNRATMHAMGEVIHRNPVEFGKLARDLFADEASGPMDALVKRMAEVSHKAVFQWQDILQLTLQKGLERKGLSTAQATEQIAKTFPPYRTPSRVADQRWLGQALQSQAFFNFPKFMYNRFQGAINIIKDLKGPERAHAIDQLLTIALVYYAGKTLIDPFLKQATGNKNAEAGDFGYGVFPGAIEKLAKGTRTPGQTFQGFTSPGYLPQAYDMARGVNAFLGKPTSIPGETPKEIGYDYANEIAQKLSPVQRFGAVQSGKQDPDDLLWSQLLGVKYPSDLPKSVAKQLKSREKYGTPLEADIRAIKKKVAGAPAATAAPALTFETPALKLTFDQGQP